MGGRHQQARPAELAELGPCDGQGGRRIRNPAQVAEAVDRVAVVDEARRRGAQVVEDLGVGEPGSRAPAHSTSGPRWGSPRMRRATMLSWISELPPAIVQAFVKR